MLLVKNEARLGKLGERNAKKTKSAVMGDRPFHRLSCYCTQPRARPLRGESTQRAVKEVSKGLMRNLRIDYPLGV
jgi:hypothetical protein